MSCLGPWVLPVRYFDWPWHNKAISFTFSINGIVGYCDKPGPGPSKLKSRSPCCPSHVPIRLKPKTRRNSSGVWSWETMSSHVSCLMTWNMTWNRLLGTVQNFIVELLTVHTNFTAVSFQLTWLPNTTLEHFGILAKAPQNDSARQSRSLTAEKKVERGLDIPCVFGAKRIQMPAWLVTNVKHHKHICHVAWKVWMGSMADVSKPLWGGSQTRLKPQLWQQIASSPNFSLCCPRHAAFFDSVPTLLPRSVQKRPNAQLERRCPWSEPHLAIPRVPPENCPSKPVRFVPQSFRVKLW